MSTLTTPHHPTLTSRVASPKTVVMCRPDYFTVSYRINPWMFPEEPTNQQRAIDQWESLHSTYLSLGIDVELIDPIPGLPDMVYAANGGFVIDGIAYGAKFRHPERQPEGPAYLAYLQSLGLDPKPAREVNEGEGDFLLVGETILAAYGFRSESHSHAEVAKVFAREVLTLRLVNPSYYHLDTALAVLDQNTIAYLPEAFDEASQATLKERYPDAILANEDDAAWLGLNLYSDGHNVVMAQQATTLRADIERRGFAVYPVDMSELLRGGGGVKCCTLELRR